MSALNPLTSPNPIDRLPMEILDNIFAQVTPVTTVTSYPWSSRPPTVTPKPISQQLRAFALVCQAWRSPCQRLLFRSMALENVNPSQPPSTYRKSIGGFLELVRGNPDLGRYVQKLVVSCRPVWEELYGRRAEKRDDDEPYGTVEVWQTLDLLPALHSLCVRVTGNADFSSATRVHPALRALGIDGGGGAVGRQRIHRLLAIFNRITSLSLWDTDFRVPQADLDLQPLDLPFFTRLKLAHVENISSDELTKFFSPTTISNIHTLHLCVDDTSLDCLRQWENLKILRFVLFSHHHEVLSRLPSQLEELYIDHHFAPGSALLENAVRLPNSVRQVIHRRFRSRNEKWDDGLERTILSGNLEGKNVKEVVFINCGHTQKMLDVVEYLKQKGVSVVETTIADKEDRDERWY